MLDLSQKRAIKSDGFNQTAEEEFQSRDLSENSGEREKLNIYCPKMSGQIARLEDLSTNTYLAYLEHEAAAYVNLTQSDSTILRSIAPKMVTALKNQLSRHVGCNGVTSTSLRQKMLEIVLSERFPSPIYANIYVHKRTAKVSFQIH